MFVTQCSAILGSSSAAAQLSQKEIHIAVLLYQFYVYRRAAAAAAHNYHRERYIVLVCTPGWSTCHKVIANIIIIIVIIKRWALM